MGNAFRRKFDSFNFCINASSYTPLSCMWQAVACLRVKATMPTKAFRLLYLPQSSSQSSVSVHARFFMRELQAPIGACSGQYGSWPDWFSALV